jgi:hypothetical protein
VVQGRRIESYGDEMSDEQEFVALRMSISRRLFPVAHTILDGKCDQGCNGPAVERPGDAAYHWQRFQDAVLAAWASRKSRVEDSRSASPTIVTVPGSFQDNIARAYGPGGELS